MEFRFRAKDERGLPLNSIRSTFFPDEALQAGSVGYTGLKNLSPEGRSVVELERELLEEKIKGEIIARRIMQNRMLEEEAQRNFKLNHKMSRNPTEDHQSYLLVSNMCDNVAQRLSSSPAIEEIKEMPMEVNIPVKNSALEKRKYNTTFEETFEVKHQKIIKEWGCAVCHVSATSEDGFNDHLKGQNHLANVLKLGHGSRKATESSKCDKILNDKAGNVQENKGADGGELNCTICGVSVTSKIALTEHLKGKKHLAKANQCKKINGNDSSLDGNAVNTPECQVVVANLMNGVHDAVNVKDFYCKMCNVNCSSEGVLASHLNGKKHLGRAQKMLLAPAIKEIEKSPNEIKLPKQDADYDKANSSPPFAQTRGVDLLKAENIDLNCTLCQISVTCKLALQDHLKGKKHLANVIKHSYISKKEMENSFSSNSKAITTADQSKDNVENREIHYAAKEKFSAAENVVPNV